MVHKWDKFFTMYKFALAIGSTSLAVRSNEMWCDILIQLWDLLIQ
jgi:hypothetical protein